MTNLDQSYDFMRPVFKPEYIYIFLGTGRFSISNDVTPDKVNYRPDIRQNFFFEKNSGH